jgi:hypothetical protein
VARAGGGRSTERLQWCDGAVVVATSGGRRCAVKFGQTDFEGWFKGNNCSIFFQVHFFRMPSKHDFGG